MKKLNPLSWGTAIMLLQAWFAPHVPGATITVDGTQTNQYVDGFGVNANYWSYTNSDLNPVLDALIDQAGMTLFRVVFNNGWETDNDNNDPNVLNQSYYDTLYAGPEFQKLWGLLGHLEQKGLSNGIVLNFQGPGPDWMGGNTMASGMEEEWAEMVVSLLLYARTNRHLQFHLVAPDNEPDLASEGIHAASAAQYVTMLQKLAQQLDAYGLSDFRLVVPDRTQGTNFFPEIMNDPAIMAKVAHFGMHSYSRGGSDTAVISSLVNQTPFQDRKTWITEFNVWCESCETGGQGTNDWEYFRETADYLLDHLNHGASAGMVWEGYDSFYPHHDAWSFWGLFAVDDTNAVSKTYTPRKNFYTLSQISRFVRPGSRRIGVSGLPESLKVLGFYNDDSGQLALTGINIGADAIDVTGTLLGLPTLGSFDLYYTTSGINLGEGSVQINSNSFHVTIPGDCVFTLTGVDAAKLLLSVHLTSPADGTQYNPPATISLQATATTSTGSVSKVEFFGGSTKLGEDTSPPYSLTWSNVPIGAYILTARASNTVGIIATSGVVRVVVPGPAAQIGVKPSRAITFPNGTQRFSATAMDAFGTVLDPQPVFAWSASGGAIDSNGLFVAESAIGGPFAVTAASGGITSAASIYVATNLASAGTGYTWCGLSSAVGDSPRTTTPGINDGDLFTDVPLLPGGGVDTANAYEAAGVLWPATQTVRQVIYWNGSWTFDDNGVFAADLQLQFSADGTTWTAAGPEWLVSPDYVYNSPVSANRSFTFQGGTNSVRGVRCLGRVHTSEEASPPNSWVAYATETQVFNVELIPALPLLSAAIVSNAVAISWPSSAGNYILEGSVTVSGTNEWSVVTNMPQQIGQENRVTIVPTPTQRFFRLRLQ